MIRNELKVAYDYSKVAVRAKTTPKYVKKQYAIFNRIVQGKHKKAKVSIEKLKQCYKLLYCMRMPDGINVGKRLTDCLIGYQWMIIIASLCIVWKKDPEKNFFKTIVLEIPRKNWKSFTAAVIMILAMFMLPDFSKLFSVAADGSLSRMVKTYMSEIIVASPELYEFNGEKRFEILLNEIRFLPKSNKYEPLNYSNSRLDGRQPSVYIVDEAGALINDYAINAMRSGQILVKNPLGFIISTKYPRIKNPFEDLVRYAKRVLDGIVKDETLFALLFEPDEKLAKGDIWMTDDLVIKQANPAALIVPQIFAEIKKLRQEAIDMPSKRSNFLCKHLNILSTEDAQSFIDIKDLKKCRVDHINWKNRDVYIGADLSQTDDITAIGMVAYDEESDKLLVTAFPFIPAESVERKTQAEHVEYQRYIDEGKCYACGDRVISYKVIEDFVFSLERRYGVHIVKIGYDRYNCISSANRWAEEYETVEVKQHSSVLHSPTKLLKERILSKSLEYEDSELLEMHFANAKCVKDTNLNLYINKKKSVEKIDMAMSILDALCLLNTDIFESQQIDAESLIQVG